MVNATHHTHGKRVRSRARDRNVGEHEVGHHALFGYGTEKTKAARGVGRGERETGDRVAAPVEDAPEAGAAAHRDEIAEVEEVDVRGERGGGLRGGGETVREPEQVRTRGDLVHAA